MTRYRVSVADGTAPPQDAILEVVEGASAADVIAILQSGGLKGDRIYCNGVPVFSGTAELTALTHGATIATTKVDEYVDESHGRKVVVVSGPDAGLAASLEIGHPVRVGRTGCELRASHDRMTSKSHAQFDWDGTTLTVTDLDSANGTQVEGVEITGPTVVGPGTFVHVGSSVLTVLDVAPRDVAQLGLQTGPSVAFPRSFREALNPLPDAIKFPSAPNDDDIGGMGNSWWRYLIPLVSAAAMAVIGKNYWFLAIAGLGPIAYLVDYFRRKQKSKSKRTRDQEKYERDFASRKAELQTARLEERRRARVARPFGGVATVFATTRHRRLWERRPGDPEFLAVTVGLATRPSSITATTSGRDEQPDVGSSDLWGMPVDVNLRATGSLAVLGAIERAQAVVRGMVVSLAVTHSPSDLHLWVFGGRDAAAHWGFARWLPHTMIDDTASRIASTPESRGELWALLKQQLEQRAEATDGRSLLLPVHVVVVDGADLIPASEIAAVLENGPALGIIGIVVDDRRAPDGIMGRVTLGAAADEAVFESRDQPVITDVLTAEMANEPSTDAALRMAALSPSMVGPRGLAVVSPRLINMLGDPVRLPANLAASWANNGPVTRTVVGLAAESEFSVDIVRNGPHGLIGGATRSGKTEFLKTLIMSLAAANHPDDLSFVIIDFKGGVDYTLASQLPHVLEVSSNQNLDRFERTIRMLTAEQGHRQRLFERESAANLDAYRAARKTRPNLPPVPRLVVLVDEFGELYASEVGKAQLKKLESVTRIGAGLGVNLALITQNFQGQLPDQIAANTGLRVCFRVQEAAHSKVLLGSGIAATLDPSLIGRGYAQLKGSEPIEFQSARIAGRRSDLEAARSKGTLHLRPFSMLPYGIVEDEQGDVPADETDMHALTQTICAATKLSGWFEPAISWPEELPSDAPLRDAIEDDGAEPGTIPFGLVDLPDEQRRGKHALTFADDHVLLLGGARADLQHALTMVAVGSALANSPDDLHIYGLDLAGRGLARISKLPHCGAVASRNDALSLRILEHLSEEVARRRSLMAANNVANLEELRRRTGIALPHVLLLVAAAERMLPSGNAGAASPLLDPMTTLISDSSGLGVQVMMAGLPVLANFRPGSLVSRRLVFETVDPSEAIGLGVERSLVADLDSPRKFVDTKVSCSGVVCSLSAQAVDESDALDAFVYRIGQRRDLAELRSPPRVFKEVIWPLPLRTFLAELPAPPKHFVLPIVFGLDSVAGEALWVDASEDGPSFSISGERRSGRSSALIAVGRIARHLGWTVIGTAFSRASPLLQERGWLTVVRPDSVDGAIAAAQGQILLLVDDLHRPSADLSELTNIARVSLTVVAGTAASVTDLRGPLKTLNLKLPRNGISLMPKGWVDFEPLGVRRDAIRSEFLAATRAGTGVLGVDSELTQIVVPSVIESGAAMQP